MAPAKYHHLERTRMGHSHRPDDTESATTSKAVEREKSPIRLPHLLVLLQDERRDVAPGPACAPMNDRQYMVRRGRGGSACRVG